MTAHAHATGPGLGHHDHVCGFYYSAEERDAMLVPYLREGLRSGHKVVAVVDASRPQDVIASIDGAQRAVDNGQFEVYDADSAYLATGSFDPDGTIGFWEQRARTLADEGEYGFIRLTGELSWLARTDTPRDDIVRYESWADSFVLRYPMTILCLYDLQRLGSAVLMDLLRTHPKLLMGGMLLENPHHISGDEFAASHG